MSYRKAVIACIGLLLLLASVVFAVSAGSTVASAQDAPEPAAPPAAVEGVQPESCATCHKDAGLKHQASYDALYQDGVIQVTDLAYSFAPTGTQIVTFSMTKDGAPFDASKADSLAIYFAPWDGENFQFDPAAERLSLLGKLSYDGAGGNTSTLVAEIPDLTNTPGLVVLYGADEQVGTLPARIRQVKYPFAALLETGSGVDYVSSANNAGCVKCHTDPYLKHGYIYAQVNGDPATDFMTCKACHLDNGTGEHVEWQLLVEDPALAAQYLAGEVELTPEQEEQYAYKTTLMNDVHMSHAMEFPYPQSMANCATCHEGKLDVVLADENFTLATCKSCHPMNGSEEAGTVERSITTMMAGIEDHDGLDLATDDCTSCHGLGGDGPALSEIHSGFDQAIYTADGVRYSDNITLTVDSAAFDGSKLNIKFSAHATPEMADVDLSTITPTVMVGLYGWDAKDFVIGAHERLVDDNGDGVIDSKDQRALEYVVGSEHPRFTTVAAADGSWEVVADLSTWTDLVANGSVKRVEIGILPELVVEDGLQLALNAPSRTFDLGANDFADDFYAPIAKTVDGCNTCHDQLATTFHSPDYGGNIVVCRMCHIPKAGGSHLEVQSRSLDSYIHAIHTFQAFDVGDIDFSDPVAAMEYEHHTGTTYPTHGASNCASCHLDGTNNIPDQSMSLPGILSATDPITGTDRAIGDVPSFVVGPASRACGGCHRAALINADAASELLSFMQHTKNGGYMIEAGEDPVATLRAVTEQVMGWFQ
jgi:OmcA/MtrC family decaheme c-type cytochrome